NESPHDLVRQAHRNHRRGRAAPPPAIPRTSPLFQKGVATMITKECFGCGKVTSHEHLHDCAPGITETHMVGSEQIVCILCRSDERSEVGSPDRPKPIPPARWSQHSG